MKTPGNSVQIAVDPSKLRGVIAIVRAADRMLRRIENGDPALTDPTVVEAAAGYRAVREEWKP